ESRDRRCRPARHGRRLPGRDRRGDRRAGRGPALRSAIGHRPARRLAGGPRRRTRGIRHRTGGRGRHPGPGGAAAHDRPRRDRRHAHRRHRPGGPRPPRSTAMTDGAIPEIRRWTAEHAAPADVTMWAPDGLPEFRPGDDLAGVLAEALVADPRGLVDGDVVVLTSKVLSKTEGRIVPAPADPEARDELRRRLVEAESVRVVARVNRTLITENRLGIVQAAAGVDGSNVESGELALLPSDPDASAAALVADLRRLTGARVAVIVTDTM